MTAGARSSGAIFGKNEVLKPTSIRRRRGGVRGGRGSEFSGGMQQTQVPGHMDELQSVQVDQHPRYQQSCRRTLVPRSLPRQTWRNRITVYQAKVIAEHLQVLC